MAKITKARFEKRVAELGCTVTNMERDSWGEWDIMVDAPEGRVFANTGTWGISATQERYAADAYASLMADMAAGVREPTEQERAGW